MRRVPLNPMFSKRSISKFEPVIREKVELLCKGISKAKKSGDVLVIGSAFNAFAGDVITVSILFHILLTCLTAFNGAQIFTLPIHISPC